MAFFLKFIYMYFYFVLLPLIFCSVFVFQLLLFFKTSLQEGRGKGVIRDNMETRLSPKFLYICRVFLHFLSRVHLPTKPTLHPHPTLKQNTRLRKEDIRGIWLDDGIMVRLSIDCVHTWKKAWWWGSWSKKIRDWIKDEIFAEIRRQSSKCNEEIEI